MRDPTRRRWVAALSLAGFVLTIGTPTLVRANPTQALPVIQAMSTRKKVVLLAGAAALYWLYKRHQNSKGVGANGQYYRSKNGGVYYRDAKNPRIVHWVTPPPTSRPMEVPADEYQRYIGQLPAGYNESTGGGRVLTAPPGPAAR